MQAHPEADAYINQLSHLACDFDPSIARDFGTSLQNPTWHIEWIVHAIMMAADDEATGDCDFAARDYEALKPNLLMGEARADGLLRARLRAGAMAAG